MRMNEVIRRCPKEKIKIYEDKLGKVRDCVNECVSKFMHKKYEGLNLGIYRFEVSTNHFDGINYAISVIMYLDKCEDFPTKIEIDYDSVDEFYTSIETFKFSAQIATDWKVNTLDNIKETLMKEYSDAYEAAILYFQKKENIVSIAEYALQIHNFIHSSTYIYTLPLAYTFLLSNSKNKIFPKEIAKLITQKILFFKN